jgi:GcrA cell cycle regulator
MASEITNAVNSPWTEEKIARLERLYTDGVSFREIADDLGGVTRNAVIGKVHRMQLPTRSEIIKTSPPIYRAPKRRRRMRVHPVNLATMTEPDPDPTVDYSCGILDLTDTRCRFPLWRHDAQPYSAKFYCGAPGAELSSGQPYCRKHARLCAPQRQ